MSRNAWAAFVLSLAFAAPGTAEAGPCAIQHLAPRVLHGSGAEIPVEGGIVVAAVAGHDAPMSRDAAAEVAVQKGWRLRIRRARIAPVIDVIAPGLAVYRLPKTADEAELEDDAHKIVAKVKAAKAAKAVIAAPKVKRLYQPVPGPRSRGMAVIAELEGASPAGAVALVIADAAGAPRSWGQAYGGATVAVYSSGGCAASPAGTIASRPGDRVTLFWVDELGRRSAATQALTIAHGP